MNEDKYLKHIEAKRQNVIGIVENGYAGSSENLPAIIAAMNVYEVLEKYDMKTIIRMEQFIDMFLIGYDVGRRN